MNGYFEIPLTRGFVSIVDENFYDAVIRLRWGLMSNGTGNFYASHGSGKTCQILLHTFILGVKGIDHINGDGLDNRWENLRPALQDKNTMNRRPNRKGSSRFKGVSWDATKSKWRVAIVHQGKTYFLGYFDDEIEAAKRYDQEARERFRVYAWLNFPGGS